MSSHIRRALASLILLGWHTALLAAANPPEPNVWRGGDPANPTGWSVGANWSAGDDPHWRVTQDALIPAGVAHYPILDGGGSVGGGLTIAKGARLTLAGHSSLRVADAGRAAFDYDAIHWPASNLVIEGTLDASAEGASLFLGCSLINRGSIVGKPRVSLGSRFHALTLDPRGATFSTLHLSSYPQHVTLASPLTVAGDVELLAGQLTIPAKQTLTVQGDLMFCGKTPAVDLTLQGDILLHGTVTSEGSAHCGEQGQGWVKMVGDGDRVITPGGLLPPLWIETRSGKVTTTGDLWCMGLHIARGSTLDLSKGQKLLFGSTEREWHTSPTDKMIVKTWLPHRSSRDLSNQGALIGAPSVPFVLYVRSPDDKLYAVSGSYRFRGRPTKPADPDGLEGMREDATEDPAAGRLSINTPDGRLVLKGEELLLDGKPVPKPAKEEDDLEDAAGTSKKARISNLSVKRIEPPGLDTKGFANVAPCALLHSRPSIGREIWNLVDGSEKTVATFRSGVGGGGRIEFVFPKPVTASAVRFRQGGLFAIRYHVYADTDGDGKCETILLAASGGAPNAWREHAFAATTVHRLRFRALQGQQGWEQAYPQIGEFEIYADAASAEPLLRDLAAHKPPAIPAGLKRFSVGPERKLQWPEVPPEPRIMKAVMIDLWMFNIQTEAMIPKTHLREFKPFQDLVATLKGLGADTANLFIEADPIAFWPSRNFKSITNKKYFDELDQRKRERAAEGRPAEPPAIDPPSKKDILKEFVEGMHENGFKVTVLFRDNIMDKYVGPPGTDAWQTLCEEVAERGVDGVYLMGDETYFGLANPKGASLPADHPDRFAFKKRWGPESDLPKGWEQTENYKKHVLLNYERGAEALKRRHAAVKKINPSCLTLVNIGSGAVSGNNRMTYGLAYDILGHLSGVDLFGSDYVERETRTFAAAARTRKATMVHGAGPLVGEGVSSIMQGARAITYYRYNYIELWKATDHRRREFQFIRTLERWGIAQARTPRTIALLLSRASEDWWDNTHGTYWLGESPEAKKGFWTSRLVNEFLLQNGYPFDLYWLDQCTAAVPAARDASGTLAVQRTAAVPSASLRAGPAAGAGASRPRQDGQRDAGGTPEDSLARLGDYKLLIIPFPYSVSQAAAQALKAALAAGSKMLIAQQRGEVNEYGVPYPTPILQDLIEKGTKDGNVVFLDRELVEWEVEPTFVDELTRVVDGLLGAGKPLRLNRYGHRVEAHLLEKPWAAGEEPRERFLTLINWGDAADVEVGLNLPKGSYQILTLSSDNPALEAEGRIDGRPDITEADLAQFAVPLGKNEVRTLSISALTSRK